MQGYAENVATPHELTLTERVSNDLAELLAMLNETHSIMEETFTRVFGARLVEAAGAKVQQTQTVVSHAEADIGDKLASVRAKAYSLADVARDLRRRL
jgi:hypothetical protein